MTSTATSPDGSLAPPRFSSLSAAVVALLDRVVARASSQRLLLDNYLHALSLTGRLLGCALRAILSQSVLDLHDPVVELGIVVLFDGCGG